MTAVQEIELSSIESLRQEAKSHGIAANDGLLGYGELLLQQGIDRFVDGLTPASLFAFVQARYQFADESRLQPFALRLTDMLPSKGDSIEPVSLFDIVVSDRPFLIDSIQAYFDAYNISVRAILHPVLHVKRNKSGRFKEVAAYKDGEPAEVHITFMTGLIPETQRQPVLESLRLIVRDVVFAVDDYAPLLDALNRLKSMASKDPQAAFIAPVLDWLTGDHFVFMGLLPFSSEDGDPLRAREAEGLGLFNPRLERATHHEALHAQVARLLNAAAGEAPFLVVDETNVHSNVHRRNRLSAILLSPQGASRKREAVVAVGVFTNRSRREDALNIPVVSDKIRNVFNRPDLIPGSHKYKEVLDFINGMPRYELFRLSEEALTRIVDFLWAIVDQPRIEIALLEEQTEDLLRIMIATPGGEVSLEKQRQIRESIESMVSRTAQNLAAVRLGNCNVITLVFQSYSSWKEALPERDAVAAAIWEALLTRDDRLVRQWTLRRNGEVEERLARTLMAALPEEYKVSHEDWEVMTDLDHLELLVRDNTPQFQLRPVESGKGFNIVLYVAEQISLSQVMPILSNLGVHVIEERSYVVNLPDRPVYLHTFLIEPPEGFSIQPEVHGPLLDELIFTILMQRLHDDPLNALLITCGFSWRQINLMCLYRNYLMQVGTVYTRNTINGTLIHHHQVTGALLNLFDARFNPDLDPEDKSAAAALDDTERQVDNLTEDRILKGIRNLIEATTRTNFYRDFDDPVIAVKMRSAAIEALPRPRPLFEIYVYGPVMEGIHLRGDMIARGGLRYSDRPDDFRTEVLGLMATQMKKNALIVPLGSKGGYVVTNLVPYDGDVRAAGDAQYKLYIRALLSVTDNLVDGKVVPPERVRRYDADDTYLVVAADKGTAHLSDTANATAREMGFWLDDAFASGGSNGYDHKVVGITARGGWESVKRHFWEMGTDIQSEPFTVVGIGDMSGDVFGNGMLLSRCIKLVGAFDHRHIFIDPDPDPEQSFKERERLFALPRSSWEDYDTSVLSSGGGIFPRNSKEITLSSEAAAVLGTDKTVMSGEELIRTLLKAEVDLLWNGGIGTYIKSATETHTDVGDPNSNAVRIDSNECRARVIGEGGNLGLTQQARIELDEAGCVLISDAVDNAGGVNMSDHEVNLKILFGHLMDSGDIASMEERNAILAELEPPVTAAVLRANFRQVLVISMDRSRSKTNVSTFIRLVDLLAAEGGLDRRTESIPNTQRFQQYQTDGSGIPRPVLSVLLSYAKMLLYRRLVDDPLVSEPFLASEFGEYFPEALRERFTLDQVDHPLRRHIVATRVTNRVIDQAGMTCIANMAELTGVSWPAVVRAYLIADMSAGGAAYRENVYAQASKMPAEWQYDLLMRFEWLLGEMTRWLLLLAKDQAGTGFLSVEILGDALHAYVANLSKVLPADEQQAVSDKVSDLQGWGIAAPHALMAGIMPHLGGFLFAHQLTQTEGFALEEAHTLVAEINQRFGLTRLAKALEAAVFADSWQKQLGDRQRCTIDLVRDEKLTAVLQGRQEGTPPSAWVDTYLETRQEPWKRYQDTLQVLFSAERASLVALAVAVGQLEAL